jgi:predicted permease
VIPVALAIVFATAAGVAADLRTVHARRVAELSLGVILYGLVPFISYTGFSHLSLSLGAAAGLVLAYVGNAAAGFITWRVGMRLGLPRASLGALISTVILSNTGYFGFPVAVALLGEHALIRAVAYDQLVGAPLMFTAGFAVGAAFSGRPAASPAQRIRTFLGRNPPLWAAVAGLLAPASLAPAVLVSIAHVLTEVVLVIGFTAVGIYLSSERREDHAPLLERPDRRVLLAMAARFGVTAPLLFLASLLGVSIPTVFILEAAAPSAISALLIGHAYGLDQRLAATVIVWTTLTAAVVATAISLV